ncbi:hypothetical protein DMN91_012772 [Ooceraea biroi]|uniref:Uncharacterized protein n=1 Tax=Ooceraea biroi TaxID=2015173 RepID=A0A3L8D302_OOCBI|nr:hypothetical protein DMN91_012772 [Ooceraea biroi]
MQDNQMKTNVVEMKSKRPPSSSLSYPGAGANDDARSPGSGGTPGPLSQQAPASLDSSDPGKSHHVTRKKCTIKN